MPIPEGYLPRKGDVVVVHAVVKYDVVPKEDGPNVFIRLEDDHSDRRVPLSTIVGLYSRHFDEGDRVRLIAQGFPGVVIATHEADVWVKLDPPHEGMCTVTTSDLELIPVAAEEPPVDTSDIPEAPKMRFAVGQEVTIARLGDDAVRMEQISRFVGCSAKIFDISGDLYKVSITGGGDFFVSDDMLDQREDILF